MNETSHKIFFCDATPTFVSTALVSAYNTHVYGDYDNYSKFSLKDEKLYCMLITLSGTAEIILKNGKSIKLMEKSIFFSQHSEILVMRHRNDYWHFTCHWFIPQGISIPINKLYFLHELDLQAENDETDYIIRLYQTQVNHKHQYANSLFCCRLLNYLMLVNHQNNDSSAFIDRVLLYINEHITEAIQIKDIANLFHYSERHFQQLFKTAFNTTPKQFINNLKLENIAHLLVNTSASLQELADRYNYASVSHLINSFKKKFKTTPTLYRKTH